MADVISEFRKLPGASLGGCVKGWEAWTPSEVTLKHVDHHLWLASD